MDNKQTLALSDLHSAMAFFDKAKAASPGDQAAIRGDAWAWLESAARNLTAAFPVQEPEADPDANLIEYECCMTRMVEETGKLRIHASSPQEAAEIARERIDEVGDWNPGDTITDENCYAVLQDGEMVWEGL